jgi:ATP-binding cassette, subfamily B, bacterial PglK
MSQAMYENDAKKNSGQEYSVKNYFGMFGRLFTRRDKQQYFLLLAMLGTGAILDFLGIGLIPAVIAALAAPEKLTQVPRIGTFLQRAAADPHFNLPLIGVCILVAAFVAKTVYFTWMFNLQFRLVARHRTRIGHRLFTAYMNAPWTFHLQRNSAELMRKAVVETGEIVNGVLRPSLEVILGAMMIVLLVLLMILVLPWQCVAVFIMLGAICGILMSLAKTTLTKSGQETKLQGRQCMKTVIESLDTVIDARMLGCEKFLSDRFRLSLSRFAQADRSRIFISSVIPYVLEMIVVVGMVAVVWLLVRSGATIAEILPELALIGAVTLRLRQATAKVFTSLGQMHFSKLVIPHIVEDISEIELKYQSQSSNEGQVKPLKFENEICFNSVCFTYPNVNDAALLNLTLRIRSGDSVAFVGSTGSGKTTAINLLLGILAPTKGSITVDGKSIHSALDRWQSRIGFVPQVIHLLDDTVRRNIAFGVPDSEVDDQRLTEVLALAQLEETIANFENGLDTIVGERGIRISGGQRQRLGIARALYRRPSVLVMDEGTSALDNATEASLVKCLRSLEGQLTMIFVAHRLSTIEHCNRIFFLKHGTLLGANRHTELLKTMPEYSEVFRIGQSKLPV